MRSAIFEAKPRPRREIGYGTRNKDLARTGRFAYACSRVHRNPTDVAAGPQLELAHV